jgi:hypothetical protein
MNKFTRRLIRLLMLLLWIMWAIVIIAFLSIKTDFGAKLLVRYISDNNNIFSLKIGNVSHSFNKPYEFTVNDFSLNDKATGETIIQSEQLTLALDMSTLFHHPIWQYVIINHGQLNISLDQLQQSPLQDYLPTKHLQLINVTAYLHDSQGLESHITGLTGGVKPWLPNKLATDQAVEFNFTTQTTQVNQLTINNMVIGGIEKNGNIYLNNVGGNLYYGFFLAKANYLAHQHWLINELHFNHINSADDQIIKTLESTIQQLPPFTIKKLYVLNSSFDLPQFKIEKGNIEIVDIRYDNHWLWRNASFIANADNVVIGEQHFADLLVRGKINPQQLIIEKAESRWNRGIISLNGIWQDNQLRLNKMFIAGIRYTLPNDWLSWINNKKLPSYLANITIDDFTLTPSVVIDTRSDFPMQFTALEVEGKNLNLIHNRRFALSQGDLNIKAYEATINKVTLHYNDLLVNISRKPKSNSRQRSSNTIMNMTFSALTDTGLLDADIIVNKTQKQLEKLNITGKNVDPQLLKQWHIIENPTDNMEFSVSLSGDYDPLNLTGQLTNEGLNQTQHYNITHNQIRINNQQY